MFTKGYIGLTTLEDTNYGSSLTGFYTPNNEHNLRLELGFKYSEENSDELKNFGSGVLTGDEVEQDDTLVSVKGTPGIFIGDNDRQLSYLSIQDEWAFANDWELTAGIRYDNYSDFGSTINPRLALVWQTHYNLTTKFLYGSAFRAPSFGELYAKNNPVLLGNPELNPEKIKTYEVALDYRPNFDWQINVNIFKYFATDLFKYEPQTDGTVQLQNSQKQNGLGLEVDAAWEVTPSIKSKLGLALQSSEYAQGVKVADAPQKSVNWQLSWAIGNDWHLNLHNRWILDRSREVGDNRKTISDYSISDLTALYTLNDKVEMSFTCKNLFDKKAFEPSGPRIPGDYPLETRGFWLSLNYSID
ncbi:TonB-dependent receptor plug domain-containing protein [Catenovulum agarivorans]|uniref:TonB-dependent receptor plug domain-containing protein n=1 Tax=Catenovulum agarivorans TaxID=1172192 RepID=UPI0002E0BC7E|nr:TonB-dependent receptor [Catenovulum agarivorans]